MSVFYRGDVFKVLDSQIKSKSVDLIYIDPPFGTTQNYGSVREGSTIVKGETRTNLVSMKRDTKGFSTRPAELVKLMIDSYSKPGDVVLDCFCYRGLSYTQCKDRRWIGIDLNFVPSVVADAGPR